MPAVDISRPRFLRFPMEDMDENKGDIFTAHAWQDRVTKQIRYLPIGYDPNVKKFKTGIDE